MQTQAATGNIPPPATLAIIHDLLIGGGILIAFIVLFTWRQGKFPATGTVVDVYIDAAVVTGALSVLWRIAHQVFANTLSAEEHIIFAIGCVVVAFVLSKRLWRNFAIAWSRDGRDGEPSTEDAYRD